jgi:flagellar basal-body rod protein FlgF
METPTYIAISSQLALRTNMDIIANNMANMNTPAFKAERLIFIEHLKQPTPNDKQSFVQDIGTMRDISEGPLQKTDNPFDLAISGEGYFTIETPLGNRYTRHGRFQLDAESRLVTGQGNPVLDNGGSVINIPAGGGRVEVSGDGTLSTSAGPIAKFGLVKFEDEQRLNRSANNLYIATDGQEPQDVENPKIAQGMLEESNVQAISELNAMIKVHRSHQSLGRAIQQEHERQMKAITRISRRASGG